MSEGSIIAVVIAGLGLIGQVINYVLALKIRNAILESEKGILEKVDDKYVDKAICIYARCSARGPTS